ncbi:MAG: hypothetical protein OXE50_06985 [Chloroflexi bacterium]|nr:hypothetical protein [Chloroflexota bacterium]
MVDTAPQQMKVRSTERRIDGDTCAAGEISGGSTPDGAMEGTAMARLLPYQPLRILAALTTGSLLFVVRGGVCPGPELGDGLVGAFDIETETVGLVTVAGTPSLRRVRLDEVGKCDTHLHLRVAE